jgi:hypothetical protein
MRRWDQLVRLEPLVPPVLPVLPAPWANWESKGRKAIRVAWVSLVIKDRRESRAPMGQTERPARKGLLELLARKASLVVMEPTERPVPMERMDLKVR